MRLTSTVLAFMLIMLHTSNNETCRLSNFFSSTDA
ncbi:unnamed protein product [Amoebophrya sp. A25]|nr:unnamed protein product [Amoebophrya sp. A25]|eukprot:GSA25T00026554001.1